MKTPEKLKKFFVKKIEKSKYDVLEEQNKWLWEDFLKSRKNSDESKRELMELLLKLRDKKEEELSKLEKNDEGGDYGQLIKKIEELELESGKSELTKKISQLKRESCQRLKEEIEEIQQSMASSRERNIRNILIIGKMHKGKSTLGNIFSDSKYFIERSGGERLGVVMDREINANFVKYKIIDTVGNEGISIEDLISGIREKENEELLRKLVEFSDKVRGGVNQIFLVVESDFTQNDIKWVESYVLLSAIIFGREIDEVKKYVTVVVNKYNGSEKEKENVKVNILNGANNRSFSTLIDNRRENIIFIEMVDEDKRKLKKDELIKYLESCQDICQPKNLIKLSKKIDRCRRNGRDVLEGVIEYIRENEEEIMEKIDSVQSSEALKRTIQENKDMIETSLIRRFETTGKIIAPINSVVSIVGIIIGIAKTAACSVM